MNDTGTAHAAKLESQLKQLMHELRKLSATDDIEGLIPIIHQPGWTTPAELLFASGVANNMIKQIGTLNDLKGVLVNGSREVGLKQ